MLAVMERTDVYYLRSLAAALFGAAIAAGALLDGAVALPLVDGGDLIVGAGIAVAGAGAAMGFRRDRTPEVTEPSGRRVP